MLRKEHPMTEKEIVSAAKLQSLQNKIRFTNHND